MTCPKCGAELKDGNLLCEICGEEINYVPDFEPEIEQSISETLSELQIHDISDTDNISAMDEDLEELFPENHGQYAQQMSVQMENNGTIFAKSGEDAFPTQELVKGIVNGDGISEGNDNEMAAVADAENGEDSAMSDAFEAEDTEGMDDDAEETDFEDYMEDDSEEEDFAEDDFANEIEEDFEADDFADDVKDGSATTDMEESAKDDPGTTGFEEDSEEFDDEELADDDEELADDDEELADDDDELVIDDADEFDDGYEEEFDDDYEDDFDEDFDDDFDDDFGEEEAEDYDDASFGERVGVWFQSTRNKILFGVLLAVILFAVVVIVKNLQDYIAVYHLENSYSYHMELAQEYAISGNYVSAIEEMERAVALNPSDSSLKFALADYYFLAEEEDKAILLLWEIIYGKQDNYWLAYQQIVNFYVEKEDYNMVRDILAHCDDPSVLSYFTQYLANAPEFSQPEGVYEDSILLQLNSNTAGTIYYTLDGTEPTKTSPVYEEPILLKYGTYEIKAFFVNQYGVESDVVSLCYRINSQIPDPPVCNASSGDYLLPELIELESQEDCTFYYTLDGSTPTINSQEYTGPIPMPVGMSHFCFVAYNDNNVYSEISEYDYYLVLESHVDINETIDILHHYDYVQGKTTQLYGTMTGGTAKYSYTVSSAIQLEENVYYIVEEYLDEPNGNEMRSGNRFLVDISDGSVYLTQKDPATGLPVIGERITPDMYQEPTPEPATEWNTEPDVTTGATETEPDYA